MTTRMVAALVRTLSELADKADVIAVAGDNRFVDGVYVPSSAEVMHAMRDNIRALERQVALADSDR